MIKNWWNALTLSAKRGSGFNETGATARHTEGFVWVARITFAALIVVLAFLVLVVFWLVYPYSQVQISEPGPLIVDERTSEGVPVVRVGEDVNYSTSFCNDGVNTTIQRWADLYSAYEVEGGAIVTPAIPDMPVAAFELADIQFFSVGAVCQDDIPVNILLPSDMPVNAFYRIRTYTSYSPNPMRTITNATEIEEFLYLEEGLPIP